ncbi:hypothetical protein CVS47_02181 [Microbacterium lemovicicum]|uniref:Uncharacterized protein n=1 Tax=Microbacterium lemovicicum TaxID=1072463 RepID=A0A3S9WBW9_9MICO|nr:hypothetical protein [Microbacterium lemovicicum]AZS37544.1 hypothetical protein CVS47_02181 [Microbacterium lemovicicum]
MAKRTESDEHYVLDLCDEVLGIPGNRQARFDWLLGDASPTTGRAARLPVDGYWPNLNLAVEFQEKQHTEAVPLFDRRATVSGVTRGEQRRLYDQRKAELIPANGLRLVVIHKSAFPTRRDRIVRQHDHDIATVREHLHH